jgi:hypothetical protein
MVQYGPSVVGVFEIDASGAYHSVSYPAKGSGTASAGTRSVTFSGGPYDGWVGRVGSNARGAYIHIGGQLTSLPSETVRVSEHICYRQ